VFCHCATTSGQGKHYVCQFLSPGVSGSGWAKTFYLGMMM
jgi:hypothetical protein